MRNNVMMAVLAIFSSITLAHAQRAEAPPASAVVASEAAGRLPVKRVVLYKNGVGYFENSTHVRGTQDLDIDFISAQLNDALKSLTVVDLGDGRITGVRFNSVAPRDVIIEHPIRPEWKLAEGAKPEKTTASLYRFRMKVGPKAGAQLVVEEYHPLATRVELSDLSDDEVTLLTEQKRMTPELKQALKRVLDQKGVIGTLDQQIRTRQQEENSIGTDQGRIRENMKALKGSSEEKALLQRYTHQLNELEDRLAALRSQTADLTAKRQQAADQLDKILAEISLDQSF